MRNDALDSRDGEDRLSSGPTPPRFPIASQGYDRAIVDRRFAELERELSELDRELAKLEASRAPGSGVAVESEGFGKKVSSILIAAHESAAEIRRLADVEAERRIAEAESRVRALTEDANREMERLQNETGSLRRERERLVSDIRTLAVRLRIVADRPFGEPDLEPWT
jgi:cell division septum initiation protein DivIVA